MTDWSDRIIDEHQKRIKEMRYVCATQMKFGLYRNPAFKFYQSLGIHDLFQGFRSDNIDLGVYHFYWDKNAENTIEYIDPETGERKNNKKGDWRERWYEPGEELKPVGRDPRDPQKMTELWERETRKRMEKQAQRIYDERLEKLQDEHWRHIPKPFWEEEDE